MSTHSLCRFQNGRLDQKRPFRQPCKAFVLEQEPLVTPVPILSVLQRESNYPSSFSAQCFFLVAVTGVSSVFFLDHEPFCDREQFIYLILSVTIVNIFVYKLYGATYLYKDFLSADLSQR